MQQNITTFILFPILTKTFEALRKFFPSIKIAAFQLVMFN